VPSSITVIQSKSCGTSSSFSGNVAYPAVQPYLLGTSVGNVLLTYDALSVPDRFILYYNGFPSIDTGYRGSLAYDFGGASRTAFTNALLGKIDPITGNTYPFTYPTHAVDGYPFILGLGSGTANFNKSSSLINTAEIRVYAPMTGTVWSLSLGCPNGESSPSGTDVAGSTIYSTTTPVITNGTGTIECKGLPTGVNGINGSSGTSGISGSSGTSPVSQVTGTGTTNKVAKWTSTSVLNDSIIYDNGTQVVINGTSPLFPFMFTINGSTAVIGTLYSTSNVTTDGQISSQINAKGNSGTAVTFNWNDGNIQTVTMTDNATFTFSNPESGASYQIIITQDVTGGRTITWPTIHWAGKTVPSLTGTDNSVDIVTLTYDGAKYLGVISKNHGTP
jgi:hypothetical protein